MKEAFLKRTPNRRVTLGSQSEQFRRKILKLMEGQLLTIAEIAAYYEMEEDKVRKEISQLEEKGLVVDANKNLLHRYLEELGLKPPQKVVATSSESNRSFTLTMKGYFKLHPVVVSRE
jgi:biotin operon repressor